MNIPVTRQGAGRNWILSVAALMIIIYGLKTAQAIVVPILLALFVSMVGTPPLFWMRRKGVPNPLAVLLVVLGMLSILVLIGSLVGTSIADFTSRVPYYQQRLDEQLIEFLVRNRIHLEICPTANIVTNVFDEYSDHPIDFLYDAGVSVGVNSDARTLVNVSLTDEYMKLASVLGWTIDHFYDCNRNSLEHAFISSDEKDELRSILDSRYSPHFTQNAD